jgi:FkbM family methyltransferase
MNRWSAANRLYAQGLYAEALEQLKPLLSQKQPDVDAATMALNVARCLRSLRRFDEAEPWYHKALAPDPGRRDARWEYAMQCLTLGRFTPGWGHYEQRFALFGNEALHIQPFVQPMWQGEPLESKTILIHGEQGFSDEIMFASVVTDLIARAARVVLACSEPLHALFERSFPGAIVVPLDRSAPAAGGGIGAMPWLATIGTIHYQIPSASLAQLLRADASAFPKRAFLQPDDGRVAQWKERLTAAKEPNERWLVGIAWSDTRATSAKAARKNIPLELLRPLSEIPGVRLVTLQAPAPGEQSVALRDLRMLDVSARLVDFDETAAVISALDLVITVDSTIAHIAGALGQRTLLALSHGADWRWGTGDRDAWWYPELRMTRQPTAGDWAPVVASLTSQLRECVGQPRAVPSTGQPVRNVLLSTVHGSMIVDRHELAQPSGVAAMLASQGAYEPEEMTLLREIIRYLPRGTVVLDIGANIGAHTLEFARATSPAGGMVLAFEAQRMLFQMLGGNLAMNNHMNVECHHVALGATPGELLQPSAEGTARVRQARLDSFALPRVEMMRIGVAGMEVAVLQGAMETIARCKPVLCVDHTRGGEALPSLLIQLGYRVYVMNARNYICVHPSRPLITLTGLEEVTRRPPPTLTDRLPERSPQMAYGH